jgi:hypothetical protein
MARAKQHNADLVLVVALFFIYAACALLLCALGANTYRQTAATMQTDYNQRTGVLYLAEKTRQNDIGGALRIDNYKGNDALVLTEQESGQGYETWIFVVDGKLYEEFIAPGAEVVMQSAQTIMPMTSMTLVKDQDNLINITLISSDGVKSGISLALRSGGGTYNTGEGAAPTVPDVQVGNPQASGPGIMTPAPGQEQAGA